MTVGKPMQIKKPTFLIIGAGKCGTTALASILDSHPDVCMSSPKEVSFFQDILDCDLNPNYAKGWLWYKRAFAHYRGEAEVGEATPSYSDRTRSPGTAQRIHEFNPNMKIIYMVRDPFRRQVSAWRMWWAMDAAGCLPSRREQEWAAKGFDYWMCRQKEAGQWSVCRYTYQLAAYERFFQESQLCVSFLEDWTTSKAQEVRRIMGFLGLDGTRWDLGFKEERNSSADRVIERQWLKQVRTSKVMRSVVGQMPQKVRDWARSRLVVVRPEPPAAAIAPKTKREFLEFVRDDAREFLTKFGKPVDLWNLQ